MTNKVENALVTIDQAVSLKGNKAFEFFTDETKIKPLVDAMLAEADKHVPDLTTDKGRKAIGSNALKVSTSRKLLESAIDACIADAEAKVKKGKSIKKEYVTEPCNAKRKALLRPRDEWQAEQDAIEAARVSEIRTRINSIVDLGLYDQHETKESIGNKIDAVEAIDITEDFAEFSGDAMAAVKQASKVLNDRVLEIIEQERLREIQAQAEEAERKAQEAEKRMKIDAKLNNLRNMPMEYFGKSAQEVRLKIEALENYEPKESDFFDRTGDAAAAITQVVAQLKMMLGQAEQIEEAKLQRDWADMVAYASSQLVSEDVSDVLNAIKGYKQYTGNSAYDDALAKITARYDYLKEQEVKVPDAEVKSNNLGLPGESVKRIEDAIKKPQKFFAKQISFVPDQEDLVDITHLLGSGVMEPILIGDNGEKYSVEVTIARKALI